MLKKKNEIYGYVKASDGTEFTIIEKKFDVSRQVVKIRSKLVSNGESIGAPTLCLYNCGEYFDADDILGMGFTFDEDSPETGCIHFLEMLQFPAKIASVLHQSKFNTLMIGKIINNPDYLSESVIKELALSQDIFNFQDFILSLEPTLKFRFFTENPYRTPENMKIYSTYILDLIRDIIWGDVIDCPISNLDFLNSDSESLLQLYKISEMFFDNTLDFHEIQNMVGDSETELLVNKLSEIENINFLIESIEKNDRDYAEREFLLKELNEKSIKLTKEYSNIEAKEQVVANLFTKS